MHFYEKVQVEFWHNFFQEQLVLKQYDKGIIDISVRKPYDVHLIKRASQTGRSKERFM